jgi:pyruvate ferredoxin oxidoreductase beta subunit
MEIKSIKDLPEQELFAQGHRGCAGCGNALAVRLILKGVGGRVVVVTPTGCTEVTSSPYPETSWCVPWIHTLFENTGAVASGIEAAFKVLMRKGRIKSEKIKVMTIAGDGGTADIGFQALSGALERGHDVLHICLDNEAYMNTGIQRSGCTPWGAWTTTSAVGKIIHGKNQPKKNLPAIVAAHGIPYVATACPSFPVDLVRKVRKAAGIAGPTYIHVLCPCPVGWRFPSELTVRVGRLAVQTGVFPLYEVENSRLRPTVSVPKRKPVSEYLKLQGRFAHLTEDEIATVQKFVDEGLRAYQAPAKEGPA